MSPAAIGALIGLLAAITVPAHAAEPKTLACTDANNIDWLRNPVSVTTPNPERGHSIIHLSPRSGEWFLQVEGSAAMTNGGGTFEIRRQGLNTWYSEWVGVDHDHMLRIHGDSAPYPFVFLSGRHGLMTGHCVEPEEAFLFLREPPL